MLIHHNLRKKVDLANIISNVDKLYFDKLKNVPSSLRILNSKVDNLDIGKLETIPVHLSKLSNPVKNDVVAKMMQKWYCWFRKKGDKLENLNKKVTSNKTKHLLVENKFKKLWTFDSGLFIDQSYFNNDGSHDGLQNYLIFQPIYKNITTFSGLLDIISG